jgi:hypothetical protein
MVPADVSFGMATRWPGCVASSGRVGNHTVNEVQLAHGGYRQQEGVEIGHAHAARELVEHAGKSYPAIDHLQEARVPAFSVGQYFGAETFEVQLHMVRIQTEAVCHVERVHHVHIVGPGSRPVLPRVAAGVGADEALAPVGRRARFVVRLQRGAVVLPFVAELGAPWLEPRAVFDETLPVVVAGLVSKVAQLGALRLRQCLAARLAPGIVGFLRVQRDHTVRMAGAKRRRAGRGLYQVEHEAVFRVFVNLAS